MKQQDHSEYSHHKQIDTPASLRQLGRLLRPSFQRYRWRIITGLTALVIVDFLQLVIPRIIKLGVDGLANDQISPSMLLILGLAIIAIALAVVLLRFSWRYLIIGFSRLLEQEIRNEIFAHLVKMDAVFFEKHTTGDLMAHSSNDLSAVQMGCGMGLVAAVDAVFMSLAAIGFMVAIDPLLTFAALLPMPFLAIATKILSSKLHRRFNTVQEQFSALTEFSRSTLVSVGLIKAYTMESFQSDQFDRLGKEYVQSNLRVATIQGLISPLATLVGSIGMLVVLTYGGKLVIESTISLGSFVAFINYLYMLIWPMMAIGWVTNLVQRGVTSLNRIYNLVSSKSSLPTLADRGQPAPPDTHFSLQSLDFRYPSATTHIYRRLSLDFPPGIHGIGGRTGSGKSTLCKLLLRLYPVHDGQLFFNDCDVNQLSVDEIRRHIAYVSQEPLLFSESIRANILIGRSDAEAAEIEQAARTAAIHDDILKLSDGYETLIGERGVKLSGGQKQRLALARALVANRPILIIDDGLSAVDVATEHAVFTGLRHHFTGRTVIVVSNRIKLLSMTDRITIFKDGAIEHQGSHDELLQASSFYRAMYEKQMRQDADPPGENL